MSNIRRHLHVASRYRAWQQNRITGNYIGTLADGNSGTAYTDNGYDIGLKDFRETIVIEHQSQTERPEQGQEDVISHCEFRRCLLYSTVVFSPFVIEQLGFYVYVLSDPRSGEIFYVGKGKGNRLFQHCSDALEGGQASDKIQTIRAIRTAGYEVQHELLRFGMKEQAAFEVEAAVIEVLGLEGLTNMVAGRHIRERGRMTADSAISLFEAPKADAIEVASLLIRIPRLWYPSMPPEDLFDATHGWWRLGSRREGADYAFAINRGVIREVYRITSWRERREGDRGWEDDVKTGRPRWGFDGELADELFAYRNRSVADLFKQGESSPVKYVNC